MTNTAINRICSDSCTLTEEDLTVKKLFVTRFNKCKQQTCVQGFPSFYTYTIPNSHIISTSIFNVKSDGFSYLQTSVGTPGTYTNTQYKAQPKGNADFKKAMIENQHVMEDGEQMNTEAGIKLLPRY